MKEYKIFNNRYGVCAVTRIRAEGGWGNQCAPCTNEFARNLMLWHAFDSYCQRCGTPGAPVKRSLSIQLGNARDNRKADVVVHECTRADCSAFLMTTLTGDLRFCAI